MEQMFPNKSVNAPWVLVGTLLVFMELKQSSLESGFLVLDDLFPFRPVFSSNYYYLHHYYIILM